MKKYTTILLIGLLFALLAPVTQAQDNPQPLKCEKSQLDTALTDVITSLQSAQGKDAATIYATLLSAKTQIAAQDSACLGLDFQGTGTWVSDPIDVPTGIYRVTATSNGSFILHATVLDGKCGDYYEAGDDMGIFASTQEEAVQGAQVVFKSDGCQVLWNVQLNTAPYTVKFEKIK